MEPPKDNEPVSPMNIFAGGALYQRKPKHDPTTEPQKIDNSPTLDIYEFVNNLKKSISHHVTD